MSDQDTEDGVALRRLREALPEGVRELAVLFDPDPDAAYVGEWEVRVYGLGTRCGCCDQMRPRGVGGLGATIAEAADKCREALEDKS